MPRSSVALTREPLSGDAVVEAAGRVSAQHPDLEPLDARVVDDGAVLQILAGEEVVLSVLRPRLLPTLDEVGRLLPTVDAPERTKWWTDAYTPWHPAGVVGVAILDAAAEASGGLVVHQGLAPTRNPR
ncbi:hypothetical protein ACH3VR_12945 [Microbacterium sp. B2969]|uniref:Uncharacterized protein n=1 Tax=Microbacterium alkaliflavum TaxID=3248839 RepID=A0ABW7Q8R8_9MICO